MQTFNPTIEGTVDPDNVLPTGDRADGEDVASEKSKTTSKVKTDVKQWSRQLRRQPTAEQRVGASTESICSLRRAPRMKRKGQVRNPPTRSLRD